MTVPSDYHSFYGGCASVAGALIGLLFVAVSVAPHKLAGDRAEVAFQVGAGAAFVALLNTLIVALVALLPGTSLAPSLGLAGVGISAVLGLGLINVLAGDLRRHLGGLLRLGGLLVTFGLQLANAVRLLPATPRSAPLHDAASLCLVFFVIAINQAWRLLDARETRLVAVLVRLVHDHQRGQR